MKKLLLPAMAMLLAACQNKPLVTPENSKTQQDLSVKSKKRPGAIATDSIYGVCVHFGQANNLEYTINKIGFAIDLAETMNLNFFRTDVTLNSSGTPNATFEAFADSAYNAGFGILAVMNNPTVTAPANGTTYTSTELQSYYNQGYSKGYGFASRSSLQGKVQYIQIFNELENDNNAAILSPTYGGTQEPTVGQNDSKYNMTKYPAYLQFMLGAYTGIKTANSTIKIGTNYAWLHYGLFLRFTKDMIAQNKKLDFMLLNWYNVEEYGVDQSHNVDPNNVPMAGQAINRLKYKFLQQPTSPLVNQVGLSETGISFGGGSTPNPNNLSKGGFLTLMHNQYRPQTNMFFYYELFKQLQTKSQNPKEAQFGIQIATNPANHLVTDTLSNLY
ncbi:hypothetical protein LJ707_00775 [Mucilaginibacter sp. UR6-1]|uniref:hypothetical protein n=1 Tax=Mucilaginibacter sp. UR6-1 TaxID=1435643 RepID=UPI001E5DBCE7|nr:hypothetical protein [Mucilaginibacter sp. UR6-1]MCC8407445.1 hypothetical protein [Mucilaginibacter sp. UR6-1]